MDRLEQYRTFCNSFKKLPNKDYLNEVYRHIVSVEKPTDEQFKMLLTHMKENLRSFPTIKDVVNSMLTIKINMHKKNLRLKLIKEPTLNEDSPTAPSPIPPWILSTLELIRLNKHDSPQFHFQRKRIKCSDEDLWTLYEAWLENKPVQEIVNKIKRIGD